MVRAELADEEQRRSSIERRGFQITNTSGVIFTVAAAAWPLINRSRLTVPAEALWFAAVAAAALTAGIVAQVRPIPRARSTWPRPRP